ADGVFVIEDAVVHGRRVRGTTALGEVEVEAAATRVCLRGRDVVAFAAEAAAPPAAVRCIVPDDRDRLIEMGALARRSPPAAAHLGGGGERREAREGGGFGGACFHGFGRPQNLVFHADLAAKVVVPDVARTGRAQVDRGGALVLDSAYALRPTAADLDVALLA